MTRRESSCIFLFLLFKKKGKKPLQQTAIIKRTARQTESYLNHILSTDLLQVNLKSTAKVSVKARLEDRQVLQHHSPRNPAASGTEASIIKIKNKVKITENMTFHVWRVKNENTIKSGVKISSLDAL